MSPLCYRDRTFWLTKEKLVFDVHVKDYSPHRVMRQFSLHQEFPPPDADTLPIAKQSWSRKGGHVSPGVWVRRLAPYVQA